MKLEMVGQSDVGVSRETNEDSYGIFEDQRLGLVCDGMGGHQAGAMASRIAVNTIRKVFGYPRYDRIYEITWDLNPTYQPLAARLVAAIRLANRRIYNLALRYPEYRGMGTTVVGLALVDDQAVMGHVGDSRIYRLRNRKLEQLTEDHSWVNELIADKEIKEEEASLFEKQNVITRALGIGPTVKIDLRIEAVRPDDLYLLCSDGLTRSLSDASIRAILSKWKGNLRDAATHLIQMAKNANGSDNITVTLVKVMETTYENHRVNSPVTLTLADEDEKISALENKLLKQIFHEGSPSKIGSLLAVFRKIVLTSV